MFMKAKKKMYRFFTIADYNEEEQWLRSQHQNGWKLVKMIPPCTFIFEECEKQDVVYRLDFPDVKDIDQTTYLQLFKDCGWEYVGDCLNWSYFRKPVQESEDLSIFSDQQSKIDMINRIIKTRMLPLLVIFCGCLVPQMRMLSLNSDGIIENLLFVFMLILFVIYIYIFVHCGFKLKKMKEEFNDE